MVINSFDRHLKGVPYPPSLFKTLKGEYNLGTKDSIIWGQVHEEIAIEHYKCKTQNRVENIGLCLFDCGFLGSTPDGIVYLVDGDKGEMSIHLSKFHN